MTWGVAAARFHAEVSSHYAGPDEFLTWLEWLTAQIGYHTRLTSIDGNRVALVVSTKRGQKAAGRKGALVSNSTVNRTVTEPLRRVLRRARLAWNCAVPQIDWSAHLLKEPPETIRELSAEDHKRISAVIRDDYAPAINFVLLTGLRLEEVVGLVWEDIDFGERQILIRGKGDKQRLVPIVPDVRAILWAERGRHPTAVFTYVCRRPDKEAKRLRGHRYAITYEGLKTRWRRAVTKAGVSIRFHDLRHTFATRVLRASGNIKAVSRLLGHADLKTTSRYAGVLLEDMRAAMLKVQPEPAAEAATKEELAEKKA
jgi:integrase